MTYAEFVARLSTYLVEDSTEANFAIALPNIIDAAELRCYREVDFVATRAVATVTAQITAGTYTFPEPDGFLIGSDVILTPASGFSRIVLQQRDSTFLTEMWPTASAYTVGVPPKYWSEQTTGTILIAPAADATYSVSVVYRMRPPALSAVNQTTWLATNAPDLFFAAAMVAGSAYTKNFGQGSDNPQMALSWEQQYATALAAVRNQESRRKGEGTFDSSGTPPPSSGMPS